jgi:dihydrolipoamide dehydrogenase
MKVHTVVIGAGPGGYVAAIRLAQLGIETLVVEKEYFGGVCLNVGCIPSKALIHAAKTYWKTLHESKSMGIVAKSVELDYAQTISWKDGIVKKLSTGIRTLLKGNKVQILEGEAKFSGPNSLNILKSDGKIEPVEFQNCILATGSSPTRIPTLPVDQKLILDSTGALALERLPQKMTIVGGGYIGLELGMAFAKLGTQVTIVEFLENVLATFDADIIKLITRKLKKLKVEVLTSSKAMGVKSKGKGVSLKVETPAGVKNIESDYVCVCVGRTPNTSGLSLDTTGIKTDEQGFIQVNSKLQSSVRHIYAIGDISGQPMLAHKASREAEVAAEVIAGHKSEMDVRQIPAVVFSDPEIAQSGLSEKEAQDGGIKAKVSTFPYAAVGRSMTTNETEGFVKFLTDPETSEILGITIVGANASDLISEAALGIEMGALVQDMALTVHPHPTFGEILMEAAKGNLGEAIHILNK